MPLTKPGLSPLTKVAVALVASWSLGAQAQSLVELYDSARNYDATYLSSRLQFQAAQSVFEQRQALRRPTVSGTASLGGSYVDSGSRSDTDTRTSGGGATLLSSSTRSSNSTSATQAEARLGVSAQHPLFNRPNEFTLAQAERQLAQADLAVKVAEQDLIVRVSQAYFDLLASQDNLSLLAAQKTAVQEQLASAKRRFEVGTATIIDTREAEASFDLILAQEIAANGDLAVKKSALEQLVGKTGITPHTVRKGVLFTDMGESEQRWIKQSEVNPQLQARRLDLEIARLETQKAQAGYLPTVALTASLTQALPTGSSSTSSTSTLNGLTANGASNTVSNSGQKTWPGNSTNAAVGVQLNVPLFTGYAVQNRIKETLSLQDKVQKDLEGATRTVAQNIRSAFFKLRADQGQVKALEAAELSRQSAVQSNLLGYQVGVGTNIDVLNSQSLLFQTRRDAARARYEVLVGGLRLKQATGVLSADDLQPINEQLSQP
jgi:outer membrane protein